MNYNKLHFSLKQFFLSYYFSVELVRSEDFLSIYDREPYNCLDDEEMPTRKLDLIRRGSIRSNKRAIAPPHLARVSDVGGGTVYQNPRLPLGIIVIQLVLTCSSCSEVKFVWVRLAPQRLAPLSLLFLKLA